MLYIGYLIIVNGQNIKKKQNTHTKKSKISIFEVQRVVYCLCSANIRCH